MIALLLTDRCTGCQRCVQICPTSVFEAAGPLGTPPRLARPADCQTCFACELYCAADALYVDPDVAQATPVDEAWLRRSGLLGAYRRDSGWDEWAAGGEHPNLHWRMEEVFRRGHEMARQREARSSQPANTKQKPV
ncbi:MAG: ferredoxin family protein [Curvibacter sp.]|nr:ferredoxin family protein [Curvibacter sp.]